MAFSSTAFMAEVDKKHADRIPAFKGSRMHWLLEAAVVPPPL
jgi:hypothetical protein